ncbi:MAG: SDR family NAD(P)-dependent oxidoreductase, partial [Methylococcus sp.]
ETDYAELAEALTQELGGLQGLMHCAAELGHLGPLRDIDGPRWQRLLHINLTAPFLLTQALIPLMTKAGEGKVIFVGDSAVGDGKAFWGAYGVAKSGLATYSRILDEESASFGVRAKVFTPGPMRSPIRLRAYPGESLAALPEPRVHAETIVCLLGHNDFPLLSA